MFILNVKFMNETLTFVDIGVDIRILNQNICIQVSMKFTMMMGSQFNQHASYLFLSGVAAPR